MKSVALHTLGCKLNFSETSTIGRLLEDEGFVKKPFEAVADVYVINTCSVTENADKECRHLVRRIQRKAPEALVVITGCYAQLKPKEIAEIPGVDLVLGAAEKFNIARHLREISKGDSTRICSCDIEDVNTFTASYSVNDRTRTFLKVQDGCDYNCSFCTIPLARGRSRSDSIAHVLQKIGEIGAGDVKEVILTGINLGDFGKGYEGGRTHDENFFDLIKAIEEANTGNVQRFRISSIEPNLLTNEIIEFVAKSKKFMPHFHIPLQSGSNRILGLMRRRYKRELFTERIQTIKNLIPDCCIGVDVIVGSPGETDADFQETVSFLSELDFSYLHVFTYSERAHTAALEIDEVVPMEIRHQRNKVLRTLSYQKLQDFKRRQLGETRPILFESRNKQGMMEGYTDNYLRVTIPYREEWSRKIVDWTI